MYVCMYACMCVILVTTFSCNICLHRMTSYCWGGERMIKLLQLKIYTQQYAVTEGNSAYYCDDPQSPWRQAARTFPCEKRTEHSRDTQHLPEHSRDTQHLPEEWTIRWALIQSRWAKLSWRRAISMRQGLRLAGIGQSCQGDSECVAYSRAMRVDGGQYKGFSWGTA